MAGYRAVALRLGRLWLPAALLLAGMLLRAAVGGAQTAGTLSAGAYWALVDETEAAVTAAAEGNAADPGKLARLGERWAAVTQVEAADGTPVPVTTGAMAEMLRAPEPELDTLAARLAALQAARVDWPADVFGGDEARRLGASLGDILAQPAFQWEETQPTLLERFWAAVLRALYELLPAGQSSLLLNYLLTGLGALLLMAALLYAARSLFGGFAAEATAAADVHPEGDLSAEEALQKAQTLAQGGDYRNAVRYLYLSTLFLLDERGVLRYDRSRTNREYLRSVSGRPELAGTLRSVVEIFDQTWYGYRPLDAETYAAYEAAVNALKQASE